MAALATPLLLLLCSQLVATHNEERRLSTCGGSWSLRSNSDVQYLASLGCRTVGALMITLQVSSLAGLESITTSERYVYITSSQLSSLEGLQGLETVGQIWIYQNAELQSVAGLEGLTTVQSIFYIFRNAKLSSLSGLRSLQTVEQLWIYSNAELPSLAGLEGLQAVPGNIYVFSNPKLSSILGLRNLQTVNDIWIYQNQELQSLSGLESLTTVQNDFRIFNNPSLPSLVGLRSLQTAGTFAVYQNQALSSLDGAENLTDVRGELRISSNPLLSSISGLQALQSAGQLRIYQHDALLSLSGLERLTTVKEELFIGNSARLPSLLGLQSLQTAGSLRINSMAGLQSLVGPANLTTLRQELFIQAANSLTSLVGLESLTSVGALSLTFNRQLTSLTGLASLAYAWGGINIRECRSLRSLSGLDALYRTAQLTVWDSGTLSVLGGPFAPGAVAHKVEFDGPAWPRCITPQERAALVSIVGDMEFSTVPSADWQRWRSNSCGWELFTCTLGRRCSFVLAGSSGPDVRSVFVSEPNGGCGSCPLHRPRSNVTGDGVVDFAYALMGEQVGHHSICSCTSEVGPVAQLLLRGPRQSAEPPVTVCSRGNNCTFTVDGETLEPSDRVVLASSCEGNPLTGFVASWTHQSQTNGSLMNQSHYLLHDPATWYLAAPTLYQVCWRAPCTSSLDDGITCTDQEENRYFRVGDVEQHGAYARDYELVLGQNLSVPNIGFGVVDGDWMRLRRVCGEAQDGLDGLDVASLGLVFDFESLTADRIQAGIHRLCWCQPHDGAQCNAESQFMAESGLVRIQCPIGHGFEGPDRCQRCPAGRESPLPGLAPCSECLAGQFSLEGEECEACPAGTVAAIRGSSTCVACQVWDSADEDAVYCSTDPEKVLLLVAFFLSVGGFCATQVQVIRRRVRVVDVSLKEGCTIITTFGSHGLSNFGRHSFPVSLRGTGHPGLDAPKARFHAKIVKLRGTSQPELDPPKERFHARVVDPVRLELLTQNGDSIDDRLDTSMGTLAVRFPHDLYHQGWKPVPTVLLGLPLLAIMAVVLGATVLATDMAEVAAMGAAPIVLMCTAASAAVRWWPRATPLRQRMREFKLELGSRRRRRSTKGPYRAISLGKLHDLLAFFREFIRDRNINYLVFNILKPLTKSRKLSYAELVGPEEVEWFVSHFSGTAFEHFCITLRKHAETTCGEGRDWNTVRYWVCFCSNNQHLIEEELGSNWKQSAFYLTLQSSTCRGTCMVLDEQALPLTRIWCIFELLQTVTLERKRENFHGLLFCTSTGVLNSGAGSVEVAMALAQKTVEMDLATAGATSAHDEEMIRKRVQELGSFAALNHIVHCEVHNMLVCAQRSSNQQFAAILGQLASTNEMVVVTV